MTEKSKSIVTAEAPQKERSPAQTITPQTDTAGWQGASDFALLQRAAGNMAIQRLLLDGVIRARLSMSQPGDPAEKEADNVADRIVSGESKGQPPSDCGGE